MTHYLTTRDAAARLGVKADTVKRWCQQGKLPGAVRQGRDWMIPESALVGKGRGPSRWDREAIPKTT